MKALVFTISLIIVSINLSVAQINLFGVDITKYINCKEELIYRKMDCANNPYYTFAEYKNYPKRNMRFIMFDDFNAKYETKQMQNPQAYLGDLSKEISKILGRDFKVYKDANLSNPINDQYYWVLKQGNKYIVAKLFYSTFSQRNNLRVFIFGCENELAEGFANLTKIEGKNSNVTMYYSEEGLTRLTREGKEGIFTKF